jgi:hypothetical protein
MNEKADGENLLTRVFFMVFLLKLGGKFFLKKFFFGNFFIFETEKIVQNLQIN